MGSGYFGVCKTWFFFEELENLVWSLILIAQIKRLDTLNKTQKKEKCSEK